MSSPLPTGAGLPSPELLEISWSDGAKLVYPAPYLRAQCPCAECVDEWTGEVRVAEAQFPNVAVAAVRQVGAYALTVRFSDGHGTGIYSFERLRRIGRPHDAPRPPPT
jgi:DUF971 family protein